MPETPRVLIVSPSPSHPGEGGCRRRLLNLGVALRQIGWQPVLLYTDFLSGDMSEMRRWWGEHYYYQPYRPRSARWLARRLLRRLPAGSGSLRTWFRSRAPEKRIGGDCIQAGALRLPIDDYYEPALDSWCDRLHAKYSFQAVLAEFVTTSRALLRFKGLGVRTLIDTHELFALGDAERTAPASKLWIRITPEDELMALRRADSVLAIQNHDAETLRRAGLVHIKTVGHPVEVQEDPAFDVAIASQNILFVTSGHPFDVAGLDWFAREVFPLVSRWLKPEQVVVVGGIRDILTNRPPFKFLGRVPDIGPVYRDARAVIAPLHEGTGLKIKVVEALGYGKALVATPFAALGVEDGANSGFATATSAADFAQSLHRIMQNDEECRRLMTGALGYARRWNEQQMAALRAVMKW